MYFLEKQDFDSLHIWKFQFENLRESISKISALYLKLFPIWTIFIEIISNIVKFEATNWISIYRNNFQWLNLRNRLRLCYHSATGSGSLVILPRCWIAASCQSRTPNQPTISSLNHLLQLRKKINHDESNEFRVSPFITNTSVSSPSLPPTIFTPTIIRIIETELASVSPDRGGSNLLPSSRHDRPHNAMKRKKEKVDSANSWSSAS